MHGSDNATMRPPDSRSIDHVPLVVFPVLHQNLGRETTRLVLQDDPSVGVIRVLVKLGRRGKRKEVGREVRIPEKGTGWNRVSWGGKESPGWTSGGHVLDEFGGGEDVGVAPDVTRDLSCRF